MAICPGAGIPLFAARSFLVCLFPLPEGPATQTALVQCEQALIYLFEGNGLQDTLHGFDLFLGRWVSKSERDNGGGRLFFQYGMSGKVIVRCDDDPVFFEGFSHDFRVFGAVHPQILCVRDLKPTLSQDIRHLRGNTHVQQEPARHQTATQSSRVR